MKSSHPTGTAPSGNPFLKRSEVVEHLESPLFQRALEHWLAARTVDEIEQAAIRATLKKAGDNREDTAASLGISLRTLGLKLKQMGLSRPPRFVRHILPVPVFRSINTP